MGKDQIKDIFERLANYMPRNTWEDVVNNLSQEDKLQVCNYISGYVASALQSIEYILSDAILALEIQEYLGYRGGFGCGDNGNEEALSRSQKYVTKALEYQKIIKKIFFP